MKPEFESVPLRMLRDGILTSERVNRLDSSAEVFYRRLMSVVDDFGRYFAKPELLRAACYPLRLDTVTNADIAAWMAQCQTGALLTVYAVDGKEYLQLSDFRQQVRAKQSKFPNPPANDRPLLSLVEHPPDTCAADAQQLLANAHLDVNEDEGEPAAKPRRSRKTPMPEDFSISERVRRWAEKQCIFNLDDHFEYFVSKALAKAYLYADWDEGFMGAVRADWAKLGRGMPAGQKAVPI